MKALLLFRGPRIWINNSIDFACLWSHVRIYSTRSPENPRIYDSRHEYRRINGINEITEVFELGRRSVVGAIWKEKKSVNTTTWVGQNLERRNVEQPIFRNFKIANINITKYELFDSLPFEFTFSFFINCKILIFQMVKLIIFKLSKS